MLCLSWLVIWFQNSSLYHFSMFHASHHLSPVPATQDEVKCLLGAIYVFLRMFLFTYDVILDFEPCLFPQIEAEAAAVRAVAEGLCPLKIVLDRVVLTSTGVLLGCWQVISHNLYTRTIFHIFS